MSETPEVRTETNELAAGGKVVKVFIGKSSAYIRVSKEFRSVPAALDWPSFGMINIEAAMDFSTAMSAAVKIANGLETQEYLTHGKTKRTTIHRARSARASKGNQGEPKSVPGDNPGTGEPSRKRKDSHGD